MASDLSPAERKRLKQKGLKTFIDEPGVNDISDIKVRDNGSVTITDEAALARAEEKDSVDRSDLDIPKNTSNTDTDTDTDTNQSQTSTDTGTDETQSSSTTPPNPASNTGNDDSTNGSGGSEAPDADSSGTDARVVQSVGTPITDLSPDRREALVETTAKTQADPGETVALAPGPDGARLIVGDDADTFAEEATLAETERRLEDQTGADVKQDDLNFTESGVELETGSPSAQRIEEERREQTKQQFEERLSERLGREVTAGEDFQTNEVLRVETPTGTRTIDPSDLPFPVPDPPAGAETPDKVDIAVEATPTEKLRRENAAETISEETGVDVSPDDVTLTGDTAEVETGSESAQRLEKQREKRAEQSIEEELEEDTGRDLEAGEDFQTDKRVRVGGLSFNPNESPAVPEPPAGFDGPGVDTVFTGEVTDQFRREQAAQQLDEKLPDEDVTAEDVRLVERDGQTVGVVDDAAGAVEREQTSTEQSGNTTNTTGDAKPFGVAVPSPPEDLPSPDESESAPTPEQEAIASAIERQTGGDVDPADVDTSQFLADNRADTRARTVETEPLEESNRVDSETLDPNTATSQTTASPDVVTDDRNTTTPQFATEVQRDVTDVATGTVDAGVQAVVGPPGDVQRSIEKTAVDIKQFSSDAATDVKDATVGPVSQATGEVTSTLVAAPIRSFEQLTNAPVTPGARPQDEITISDDAGSAAKSAGESFSAGVVTGAVDTSVGLPAGAVGLAQTTNAAGEFSATQIEEKGPVEGTETSVKAGAAVTAAVGKALVKRAQEKPARFAGELAGSAAVSAGLSPVRATKFKVPTKTGGTTTLRGIRTDVPLAAKPLVSGRRGKTLAGARGFRPGLGTPEIPASKIDFDRLEGRGATTEPVGRFETDVFRQATKAEGGLAADRFAAAEDLIDIGRKTDSSLQTTSTEDIVRAAEDVPEGSAGDVATAIQDLDAEIFGSAATKAQVPEARQPRDVDLVVSDKDAALSRLDEALEGTDKGAGDVFDLKTPDEKARPGEVVKFGVRAQKRLRTDEGVRVAPAGEELIKKAGASAFLRGSDSPAPEFPGTTGAFDVGPEPVGRGKFLRVKDAGDASVLGTVLARQSSFRKSGPINKVENFRALFAEEIDRATADQPPLPETDSLGSRLRLREFAADETASVDVGRATRDKDIEFTDPDNQNPFADFDDPDTKTTAKSGEEADSEIDADTDELSTEDVDTSERKLPDTTNDYSKTITDTEVDTRSPGRTDSSVDGVRAPLSTSSSAGATAGGGGRAVGSGTTSDGVRATGLDSVSSSNVPPVTTVDSLTTGPIDTSVSTPIDATNADIGVPQSRITTVDSAFASADISSPAVSVNSPTQTIDLDQSVTSVTGFGAISDLQTVETRLPGTDQSTRPDLDIRDNEDRSGLSKTTFEFTDISIGQVANPREILDFEDF